MVRLSGYMNADMKLEPPPRDERIGRHSEKQQQCFAIHETPLPTLYPLGGRHALMDWSELTGKANLYSQYGPID